jgi:carboxypeptidase PM20D1
LPKGDDQKRADETPQAALNLAKAICFRTVSYEDASLEDRSQFVGFHSFLDETYPLVQQSVPRETVSASSLVYTWEGTDRDARPLLLAAHIDVVPVEPGTLDDWTHPPFEGAIADGCVWGRGTLDCKGNLIPIMEAVESLLAEGYTPARTVILAFGEDEELGGLRGAAKIADLLESRGVRPQLVVDEGGALIDIESPLLKRPIAAVGQAEKGYLTVDLESRGEGGHSSVPPKHTAIGLLARAITRLERHPFPARITDITATSMERIVSQMPAPVRLAFGNRFLTGSLLKAASRWFAPLGAMTRTTTAVTIIEGGTKDNILPQEARATVNFRLLPGETCEAAMSRVRKVIRDKRVTVRVSGLAEDAPSTSSLDSPGYALLEHTITECFPDAVAVPYLVMGMTDSRFYSKLSEAVFRFSPIRGNKDFMDLPHGTDERIRVDNLAESVDFYTRLIRNSTIDTL